MKKLLALMLALMLVFSMFACSSTGDADGENGKKKSAEDEAKETVDAFMSDLVDFKFDGIENYFVNPDSLPESITNLDMNTSLEAAMSTLPPEMSSFRADFEKIFNDVIDKAKADFSYEIKEIKKGEDKDTYVVTVALTMPNLDEDFESFLGDFLNEEAVTEIAMRLISEGKITASTTEEEMYAVIIPEVVALFEKALDTVEFEVSTSDKDLVVVEDDGKWLIDAEASDFAE